MSKRKINLIIFLLLLLIIIRIIVNIYINTNKSIQIEDYEIVNNKIFDQRCKNLEDINNQFIYYLKRFNILPGLGSRVDYKNGIFYYKFLIKSELKNGHEFILKYPYNITNASIILNKIDGNKFIEYVNLVSNSGAIKIGPTGSNVIQEIIIQSKSEISFDAFKICGNYNNISNNNYLKFTLIQIINLSILYLFYKLCKFGIKSITIKELYRFQWRYLIYISIYLVLFFILLKLNFSIGNSTGFIIGLLLLPLIHYIMNQNNKYLELGLSFIISIITIITISGPFTWVGNGLIFSILLANITYEFNRRKK